MTYRLKMPFIQETQPEQEERNKRMPTFDPNAEQPTYELLNGDYPFEIVKVEEKISKGVKTSGCAVREVTLEFFRDESFQSKVASVKDSLIDHPSCDWKFSVLAKSVHFPVQANVAFDVDNGWIGYRGWAHVSPEPDSKGKKDDRGNVLNWNRVRSYIVGKALAPRPQPTDDDADNAAFGAPKEPAQAKTEESDDCPF